MREILFCGKRIDNGEWVEGSLLLLKKPILYAAITYQHEWEDGKLTLVRVDVDPSTVVQYTGRTDKNGKRVFEGDIIRLYNGAVGVVLWSDNDQAYLIFQDPVKMVILDDFGNYGRPEYYEVIGKIHDNPELLEGGTDNG